MDEKGLQPLLLQTTHALSPARPGLHRDTGRDRRCPADQAGALHGEGRSLTRATEPKPLSGHDQSCPPLTNHSLGTVRESNSAVLSRKETTDYRARWGTLTPLPHDTESTRGPRTRQVKNPGTDFPGGELIPKVKFIRHEEEQQHGHQPCSRSTRRVLPPAPAPASLTFDVSVQGHHAGPLGAAEGRVVDVIGQRGGDAGRGRSRRRHRVLRGVFFMAGSAVLKPNLKREQRTL